MVYFENEMSYIKIIPIIMIIRISSFVYISGIGHNFVDLEIYSLTLLTDYSATVNVCIV